MNIEKLKIRNFKGIRELEIAPNGADLNVRGTNGTGKTTIYDAFLWLLFGKDSMGKSNFVVKPLGKNGQSNLNGERVEVEAKLETEYGELVELKKSYYEKWTKKRGSSQSEMTGHTCDYYINGLPVKESEYTKRIEDIMPEEIFRLLTDVRYFNAALTWQERRKILLELAGDATVEPDEELAQLIHGEDPETALATIKARRRTLQTELKNLPMRIDEAKRSLAPEGDTAADKAEAESLEKEMAALKRELDAPVEGDGKLRAIKDAITELVSKNRKYQIRQSEELQKREYEEKSRLYAEKNEYKIRLSDLERQIRRDEDDQRDIELELPRLRTEFSGIRSLVFNGSACPTCKRPYEDERIEQDRAAFEQTKSEQLRDINERGKALKTRKEVLEYELDVQRKEKAKLRVIISQIDNTLAELGTANHEIVDLPEYADELKRLTDNEKAILDGRHETDKYKSELFGQISKLRRKYDTVMERVYAAINNDRIRARIRELEKQRKETSEAAEEAERTIYLIEEYNRKMAETTEDAINSCFSLVRFKLFERQINGGIAECCTCTVGGVPYESLNNASRINAGIDIINTLSFHKKFYPPLFVDNAESVVELLETNAQRIRLTVDDTCPELTIIGGANA